MSLRLRVITITAVISLILAGCQGGNQGGANRANSNGSGQSAQHKDGKPADAELVVPGFYQSGPKGSVSLNLASPLDAQVIEQDSIAPTFNVTGYPVYKDAERNKGQHLHIILDNEAYEADYTPDQLFSPDRFKNLKPGTHTLRAFPGREWHESIKQSDGAAFVLAEFHVKSKTPGVEINKKAPLLTYSRPKGEYRWKDDPRGLLIDFYLTNANLGINDYRVRYTLDNLKPEIMTHWEPKWLKWEDVIAGEHSLLLELLDKDGKPVPFKVGSLDYNRTARTFKVLGEGDLPTSGAGNANKH